jgi:uncharacterized Rmd1/YagE family protein
LFESGKVNKLKIKLNLPSYILEKKDLDWGEGDG